MKVAKGVVCRVVEDEDMPVDDYGFRADIIVDPGSVNARMNIGQLYEQAINRTSEFVRRKLAETFPKDPDAAAAMLLDYYDDIFPDYAALVARVKNTKALLWDHVKTSIEKGIYINVPPFLNTFYDDEAFERVLAKVEATDPKKAKKIRERHGFTKKLKNPTSYDQNFFLFLEEKWGVKISPVTFTIRGDAGPVRTFRSQQPMVIGEKYMYLLCKVPEPAAPGVAHVSHHGIPVKTPAEARSRSEISKNPTRFGEDEQRMMTLDVSGEETFRLMSLQSASPEGVGIAVDTILNSEHPTQLDRIPLSTEELRDRNAVVAMLEHINATMGIDSRDTIARLEDFPTFMAEAGSLGEEASDLNEEDDSEEESDD